MALGEGAPAHLALGQRVIGEHASACAAEASRAEVPALGLRSGNGGDVGGAGKLQLSKAFSQSACTTCALRGGLLRCPGRAETGFFKREGAFQTHMRFPASQLHVVPDTVPWELAALSEPLAVCHKAVRLAGLTEPSSGPRPRVVVVGDGPLGLLLVQVLKWCGARVACVLGASPGRLARATAFGAEAVWDVTEGSEALQLAGVLEEDGELPGVAIEAAGHPSAVPLALRTVCPGGTVVLLGLSGNARCEVVPDDIVLRQLCVRGSLSSEPEDWRATTKMLADGAVKGIVTHTLHGLEQYETAIEMVRRPPEGMLKLHLRLNLPAACAAAAGALGEVPRVPEKPEPSADRAAKRTKRAA